MPGMNPGLVDSNPTLTAAFKAALLHQGLLVLALLAVLTLTWVSMRQWLPSARSAVGQGPAGAIRADVAEPAARRLLRTGFGVLWIFDGLLQAQPAMAVGMSSQVIKPSAASSPAWVQHLANWAATAWSFHPIQTAAAAVWIQVGIGVWLIVASSSRPSRLAGLVSAGWGLAVWVFGEAFGGIFAPGLTFLFGAPGAVLLYCAGGILVALPDRCWRTPAWPGGGSCDRHGACSSVRRWRCLSMRCGPGFLAGNPARPARRAGQHAQLHVPHAAAPLPG